MSKNKHPIALRLAREGVKLPAPWTLTRMVALRKNKRYCVWAAARARPVTIAPDFDVVDELGRLLAQKADLELREEALKAQLRGLGLDTAYEGRLFRAAVGPAGESVAYDNAAIRDKLILMGQKKFVDAHKTKKKSTPQVRVASKLGHEKAERAVAKKGRAA